jgi:hypothetical protein
LYDDNQLRHKDKLNDTVKKREVKLIIRITYQTDDNGRCVLFTNKIGNICSNKCIYSVQAFFAVLVVHGLSSNSAIFLIKSVK